MKTVEIRPQSIILIVDVGLVNKKNITEHNNKKLKDILFDCFVIF